MAAFFFWTLDSPLPMQFIRKASWLLPLLLSIIVLYRDTLFRGRIPINGDWLVHHFHPWNNLASPPQNTELDDPVLNIYPLQAASDKMLAEGRVPLWNPYICTGMPLLADNTSFPLSPLRILTRPLRQPWAFALSPLLHLLLLGIGTYFLAKEMGQTAESAGLAALITAISQTSAVWLEFQFWLAAICWLPWTCLFLLRAVRSGSRTWGMAAASCIGFAFLGGQLQVALYGTAFSLVLAAAFGFFSQDGTSPRQSRPYVAAVLAFCALLGTCLAAVQLLPTAELVAQGFRPPHRYESQNQLRPLEFMTYFLPDFFGNPGTKDYVGASFFYGSYVGTHGGFVGTLALILSAFAAWRSPSWAAKFFSLTALGILLLLFSLNASVHQWVADLIPWFGQLHHKRLIFFYSFSLAILAGFGHQAFTSASKSLQLALAGVTLGTAVLFLLLATCLEILILIDSSATSLSVHSSLLFQYLALVKREYHSLLFWPSFAVPAACLALGSAGLFARVSVQEFPQQTASSKIPQAGGLCCRLLILFRNFPTWRTALATGAVHAALAVELLFFGCRYNPFVDPSQIYPETEAIRWMKSFGASDRFCGIDPAVPQPPPEIHLRLPRALTPEMLEWRDRLLRARWKGDLLPPDTALVFGLRDIRGKESLLTARYRLFMDLIRLPEDPPFLVTTHFRALDSPLFSLLGTRYFLVAPDPPGIPAGFEPVYTGEVWILKNSKAFPRAYIVNQVIATKSKSEILQQLANPEIDWKEIAIVEAEPPDPMPPPLPSPTELTPLISAEVPHQIEIRVPEGAAGLLILTDAYYPGWRAYLDGTETEDFPVNLLFRGVWLPRGCTKVQWIYQPRSFLWGLGITCLGLAVLAGSCAFRICRRKALL